MSIIVEEHRKNVSAAALKYDEILLRIDDSKPMIQREGEVGEPEEHGEDAIHPWAQQCNMQYKTSK